MVSDICAIIVTYNRLEKLRTALKSYSAQKLLPRYIIVVDNASKDGTEQFLAVWKNKKEGFEKIVITCTKNLGGSGGFYLGQKKALELDINWIMVADDDAYLESDYLLGMYNYINNHDKDEISIVCGKVIEKGNCVNIHRTYLKTKWKRNFQEYIPIEYYSKDYFEPDFVSYVGVLLNKSKLLKAGLVNKDYFIWYDDTEHSYRLGKIGRIICIPAYSVLHDVVENKNMLCWKNFYGYRNNVDFFKKHFLLQFPFVLVVLIIKSLLSPLHGRSFTEIQMRFVAIKDGLLGRLGEHNYYKPGWKP